MALYRGGPKSKLTVADVLASVWRNAPESIRDSIVDDLSSKFPEGYRPLREFPGYAINGEGKLWSLFKDGTLAAAGRCGYKQYPMVMLRNLDGKVVGKMIHLLMLETFVGPRPEGMVGCHNDDDATNNNIDNLRWDTVKGNNGDIVRSGKRRGSRNCQSKLTKAKVLVAWQYKSDGFTQEKIARLLGVSKASIWQVFAGKTWQHVNHGSEADA